jgi:TIR domain
MVTGLSPDPAGTDGYAVFVSHNRQQKEWVRQLVEALRRGGLRVFFDEDSIDPGRNFVRAIGDALTRSRHVLLVLSRSALQSRWVALETAGSVVGDPAADGSGLIPILFEPLEEAEIPLELRFRNRVDLSDLASREANLRRLFAFLGLSPDVPLPPWPTSTLAVAGMEEVARWDWSGTDLLRALVRLDQELYGGETAPADELVALWTPMFTGHPETWRVLVDAPGSVVGYWHFVSLFDEDFARVRSGELVYAEITPDRLRMLELPGRYDLYFSGLGIQARYRTPQAFKLLFESLLEVVSSMARHSIFFESIWANGYTAEGVSLCRSLGLRQAAAHRVRGQIFQGTLTDLLDRPVFRLKPELTSVYRDARQPPA